MTAPERNDALKTVEKDIYTSKKFIAWLLLNLLMAAMAIVALIKQPHMGWPLASFMVGIVFSMCASTMWYLGKQAALDTAVRGFAMLGTAPKELANRFGLKDTTGTGKKEGEE